MKRHKTKIKVRKNKKGRWVVILPTCLNEEWTVKVEWNTHREALIDAVHMLIVIETKKRAGC